MNVIGYMVERTVLWLVTAGYMLSSMECGRMILLIAYCGVQ